MLIDIAKSLLHSTQHESTIILVGPFTDSFPISFSGRGPKERAQYVKESRPTSIYSSLTELRLTTKLFSYPEFRHAVRYIKQDDLCRDNKTFPWVTVCRIQSWGFKYWNEREYKGGSMLKDAVAASIMCRCCYLDPSKRRYSV